MGTKIRRALEQRIEVERLQLCQELLKGEAQDFESRARRLKTYQDLLSQLPAPWIRRLAIPLIVAALTVTLVGWLCVHHRSSTRVLLVAEASGVQIVAKQPFEIFNPSEGNIGGTRLGITDVDPEKTRGRGLKLPTSKNGVKSLYLCEGHFIVNELKVYPAEALPADKAETDDRFLDIQLFEKEAPTFYLRGGSALLDVGLWGPLRITGGACGAGKEVAAPTIPRQLPEPLHVETTVGGLKPVQITLRLDQGGELVFRQIDVNSLRFVREVGTSPGQREFVSTIQSANLSLLDGGASESFGPGTFLELEGFDGKVRQIQIGEQVKVQAEGLAHRVLSGPRHYQRDLTPSYLQYLKNDQQLGLLWAAVVFVWGMLWSGKRLLAR